MKNKYWILLVISIFAMYFMMSTFFGSAVYFAMYNMGDDGYYATVSNLLSIAQIVTLFITPFLMKKISKRNLFMIGMIIATVGFVLSGLTTNYTMICVSSVIKGIGFGCGGATMFGCLQDAITYGEWYNGYGTAGMGNAASSFCMKVGSGVGTAALGWILAAGDLTQTWKFRVHLPLLPLQWHLPGYRLSLPLSVSSVWRCSIWTNTILRLWLTWKQESTEATNK